MLTGKQLKIKRIEKDIEQREVAKTMGVTKSYISILEKEKQKIPKHIYDQWVNILGL